MRICRRIVFASVVAVFGFILTASQAAADDQTKTGAGNRAAVALAKKSPMVRSAYAFLLAQARRIQDPELRKETLDALGNPDTCIRHLANLTEEQKDAIVQSLISNGLLNPAGRQHCGRCESRCFPGRGPGRNLLPEAATAILLRSRQRVGCGTSLLSRRLGHS